MEKLKLNKIDIQSLYNPEFGQFINRFFEDFQGASLSETTDHDFHQMYEALKNQMPAYNKALEQIRESEDTKKIAELDRVRDNDLQALRDSIRPYKNAKTDERKQAYNALKIVLDEYKDAERDNYEQETIKLNTLISTLKDSAYQQYLSALKITEFLTELEQSNTEFNNLFAKRSTQNLQKETFDLKAMRRQMTVSYRKMSNYILTLAGIKQDEFYKKVLDVLNNSRKYYSDTLAVRDGKKKKTDKPQ